MNGPPLLIVLNGPPAAGKTTIARRFVADHPSAVHLDVDRLRREQDGWRADPVGAARRATDVAIERAEVQLRDGKDVVVSHYFGRVEPLIRLAALAGEAGADLHELVLFDTRDVMVGRFAARTRAAADPVHIESQELLDAAGGTRQLEAMYDRLLLVLAARPGARLVPAREGEIDATYAAVLAEVSPAPSHRKAGSAPETMDSIVRRAEE